MCDLCDRPDLTIEAYLEQLRERLTRERFLVTSVSGSTDRAESSYTVGLTAHGLPELIVLGVRPLQAQHLVRSWGDYLLDEDLVLPGEHLSAGPFHLEAVQVEEPRDHLVVAGLLYGGSLRALQLAWADPRGKWPWQPGHRARRAGQPVLGTPAPWYCHEHRPDRFDVPPHPS